MEHVGKSYMFKSVGFSENDGGVMTYHINAIDDDPKIVALNKPGNYSSQSSENDSDDDLMLISRTTTEVNSNENVAIDDEEILTPSSKRPLHNDDVGEDVAPTTQSSTNKKMKGVKIEKD